MKKCLRIICVSFVLSAILLAGILGWQPTIDKDLPVVVIILGYNFFLDEPWTAQSYVSRIVPVLEECRDIRHIIVSGGRTRLQSSTRSEAEVLGEELDRRGFGELILAEEQALTTEENLNFSAALLADLNASLPANTQIAIFSDQLSRQKVRRFAPKYFHDRHPYFFGISTWNERFAIARKGFYR